MKTQWTIATLTSLTLVLAACGGTQVPNTGGGDKQPQPGNNTGPGTLEVEVKGIGAAPVVIVGPDFKVKENVTGNKSYTNLKPGTYYVDGDPVKGYEDPSVAQFDVKAGQSAKAILVFQSTGGAEGGGNGGTNPPPPPPPGCDPAKENCNPGGGGGTGGGTLDKVEIVKITDEVGKDLPKTLEKNVNKDVLLTASQTEESICVTVKATTASGSPVSGAEIPVKTNSLYSDYLSILKGCAKSGVVPPSSNVSIGGPRQVDTLAFRDSIFTKADGTATFTLIGTHASGLTSYALTELNSEPVKVVIGAESGDASAWDELKVFFYNISHLYYGKAKTKVGLGDELETDSKGYIFQPTGARVDKKFAQEVNVFKPRANRIDQGDYEEIEGGLSSLNRHIIQSALFRKQPSQVLVGFPQPWSTLSPYLPISLPLGLGGGIFTFDYEIVEGADKVQFARNYDPSLASSTDAFCDAGTPDGSPSGLSTDGTKCLNDLDGLIMIEPKPGLGLKDLPLNAKVKVTLNAWSYYGNKDAGLFGQPQFYKFPLKSYHVDKIWKGTYLGIDKTVSHHVLTWAGPEHHVNLTDGMANPTLVNKTDHTLLSSDDIAVSQYGEGANDQTKNVFTSKVSITLTNKGKDTAHNVTVADALPAELGMLTKSAYASSGALTGTFDGQTYDSINHVATFNWNNVSGSVRAKFLALAPGESITVTFLVYLRQKPGFCWDTDDYEATKPTAPLDGYQVKPITNQYVNVELKNCYKDPYKVVNGEQDNDVTGTWFSGRPLLDANELPLADPGVQVGVDFNGSGNEAKVVIWGVRPIYKLKKTVINPEGPVIEAQQNAYYALDFVNINRERYAALEAAYPSEFKTSTLAPDNNSVPRDNPYGRNVRLSDAFTVGLDYVSAGNLFITKDETGAGAVAYAANYANLGPKDNKNTLWQFVPLLGGGDSGKATLTLRVNLPVNINRDIAWINCAYLDADNLNQPGTLITGETALKDAYGNWDVKDWDQLEAYSAYADPANPSGRVRAPHNGVGGVPGNKYMYGIEDSVRIFPKVTGEPFIQPTHEGEQLGTFPSSPDFDNIRAGKDFYYVLTNTNSGDKVANNVDMTFDEISDVLGAVDVSTNAADHLVFTSTDGGATWSPVGTALSSNGTTVVFPKRNMAPGERIAYAVKAKTVKKSNADDVRTQGTTTYTNPVSQVSPLKTSIDTTTVNSAL